MQLVPSRSCASADPEGHLFCFAVLVNFYDVLADGYHTPLSNAQIAELFYAGRLSRNQPCKLVEKEEWRTIDELFPLLKYRSSAPPMDETDEVRALPPGAWFLMLILGTGGIAALALLGYFFTNGAGSDTRNPGSPFEDRPRRSESASATKRTPPLSAAASTTPPKVTRTTNSNGASGHDFDSQRARVAQDRLNAEQRQREQTLVAQNRVRDEQRQRDQLKAAGRTERIPLDQHAIVHNVGGSSVTVKIHDHDITNIDVWTNYGGPVRMTKRKGITGSRTDETLVYQNGSARLYYVWEISGKLNHCLLRVREN